MYGQRLLSCRERQDRILNWMMRKKVPDREAFPEGNFTHAQEGKAKNPSEPFSRNKNISSGRETSWEEKNEKPSVRKELGDIRKEQEEKRKRPDRRKNARESRKKRKNMKTKGR